MAFDEFLQRGTASCRFVLPGISSKHAGKLSRRRVDDLRARLVGMIVTPATRIAQVVNAPAAQLARVFGAYARKDEAA